MWRRSRLVHMLIEKEESDQTLFGYAMEQRHQWYDVNIGALEPALRATFQPAGYDHETELFLNRSLSLSNNVCLQLYHSLMATLFSIVLTKTTINGLLSRGSMFIFSRSHLRSFFGLPDDWSPIDKRLIDIGAGDGSVTLVLKQFFNNITAVEISKVMEWRLAQHGFQLISTDKWANSGPYDMICALNLVDRHYDPLKLLADLHSLSIKSGCPVLLSLVLPISQYVEFTQNGKNTATKKSLLSSNCPNSFEGHANGLAQEVFQTAGFEILRWTKLPYLCEGDLSRAFYKLDDAVFLLRAVPKKSQQRMINDDAIIQIHDEI